MSESEMPRNGKPSKPAKQKKLIKDGKERNVSGIGKMKKKIDDDAARS